MRMIGMRLCALGLVFGVLSLASGCDKASQAPVKKVERYKQTYQFPTLAELDKTVEWADNPVEDARKLLADYLATKPQKTTVAEALALRNDSTENNERILDGLGRPPASEADVNDERPFNRLLAADIASTNPLLQSSVYETYVMQMISVGFFSFDWTMRPFAASETVVSWQTSKDKLYDKVVMRKDLTWSDGKPLTAHDVVFSYEMIMTPEIPIPAVRTGMDKIKGVHAYDDHTFVIAHQESLVTNVWNLNFPIVPKHVYESTLVEDPTLVKSAAHIRLEENPVVGGPYKIVKRQRDQEIVLERREDYYMQEGKQVRDKPRFKTVRFQVIKDRSTALLAFKRGDIDDIEMMPNQWVTQTDDNAFYEKCTKARGSEWTYFFFCWNLKTPYFEDVRVRKAMSYAMDYRELLDDLCYGLYQQSVGEFHPDSRYAPATPRTPYKQDLDKAEKLLEEAGWVDEDNDGIREKMVNGRKVKFEFDLMCVQDDLRIKMCTVLKKNLENIGVRCNVRPTEFTTMQDKARKHEFDAEFAGWGTGTDPDTTENIWKTGEERNYGQFSNPEVDKLFEAGKKEFDPEKRREIYRKIDDILWEDQPYTWLYYRSGFFGFNKELRGYMFSPRGPYSYSPGIDSVWAVK